MKLINVTPVLDTNIYAAGDVLFDLTAIPKAVGYNGSSGQAAATKLQTITIIEKDDQAAADMDIYIFEVGSGFTFGTANAAPSISDANALKCLGRFTVASTLFKDVGGCKIANLTGIGLICSSRETGAGVGQLGFAATTAGTPTQTASGMLFRFGFEC